eukprot:8186462-Lingulodinium_polyedra.AAC.1
MATLSLSEEAGGPSALKVRLPAAIDSTSEELVSDAPASSPGGNNGLDPPFDKDGPTNPMAKHALGA